MNNNENIVKKRKYRKGKGKPYCSNCGKHGHPYKNCREPITSFGIINFLISTDDNKIIDRISNELSIDGIRYLQLHMHLQSTL